MLEEKKMKKKIIGFFIVMLTIALLIPPTSAETFLGNEKKVFEDCYIEVTGTVVPVSGNLFEYLMFKYFYIRPYHDERAFVLLWHIQWIEPEVTVTIYDEKNGEILWEDTGLNGVWGLRLFWYNGIYTNEGSTHNQLVVNLYGNAKKITAFIGE